MSGIDPLRPSGGEILPHRSGYAQVDLVPLRASWGKPFAKSSMQRHASMLRTVEAMPGLGYELAIGSLPISS